MRETLTNPKVLILIVAIVLSLLSIVFIGIQFGIDFKGGTLFQVQLDEKVAPDKLETISGIVAERLDAFGLKDLKVSSLGEDSIAAQIAETDPQKIEQLEALLKTQGKFEATLDGNTLFEGSDILNISKNPADGYGISSQGIDPSTGREAFGWQMPFLLNQTAAERFSKMVFHRCSAVSYNVTTGTSYDCEKTFFFIDRPAGSVLIVPSGTYSNDSLLLAAGNTLQNIPASTSIDLLLENAAIPSLVVDTNSQFSDSETEKLKEFFAAGNKKAVIHPSISKGRRDKLTELGFRVSEVGEADGQTPWVWTATGARQIISITPGIANLDPYVADVQNAKIFSQLVITGASDTQEDARRELKSITILLETGSLPIAIKSISKETISPLLGKEFLRNVLLIGILALLAVALVIFIRYRNLALALPIIATCASEIIIILGFASFFRINMDLASIAGVLAAIGTGVDHQIIIADELMKSGTAASATDSVSYSSRLKKAFFIIFAAAATAIVTMIPLILFSFGFGKLRGFAIMTVLGALIGVLITRRAFSVFAESVLRKAEHKA